MGYSEDIMQGLSAELRRTKNLVLELKRFNDNIEVFERLAFELKRQNDLKEFELNQKTKRQTLR